MNKLSNLSLLGKLNYLSGKAVRDALKLASLLGETKAPNVIADRLVNELCESRLLDIAQETSSGIDVSIHPQTGVVGEPIDLDGPLDVFRRNGQLCS